jgi:hypothetical protein
MLLQQRVLRDTTICGSVQHVVRYNMWFGATCGSVQHVVQYTDTAITRVRGAQHLPWALKAEWHRKNAQNMSPLSTAIPITTINNVHGVQLKRGPLTKQ